MKFASTFMGGALVSACALLAGNAISQSPAPKLAATQISGTVTISCMSDGKLNIIPGAKP